MPQPPQLPALAAVFTHAPAHAVVPAGHEVTQAPALHSWLCGHALPQPPQLATSAVMSTQTLPHRVLPAGQAHWPRVQVVPAVHVMPQPPQLSSSLAKVTQAAPHSESPFPHMVRQRPRLHTSALLQAMPQPPQLRGSLRVSVQLPAHSNSGSGQAQAPFTQLVPAEQTLPHAPQLLFELGRFTHAPPQLVRPV